MAAVEYGDIYDSFGEFIRKLSEYEKEVYANYVIGRSKVDHHRPNMKYKNAKIICVHGGTYQKKGDTKNTKTQKMQCPAFIKIAQKRRGDRITLEVNDIKDEHNHPRSKELFVHERKQRSNLMEKHEGELNSYFATKSNYAAIQAKLSSDDPDGNIVTRRDLYNAKAKFNRSERKHDDDLVELVEQLSQFDEAVTKIVTNEENEVDLIYFQDARMKQCFDAFPDLLMFDGTYNVNDRRMPLIVVMIVDGSGCSQIVAFILVKSENLSTFDNLFDIFKEENPKHKDIKVIISDKSFANRTIFRKAFPEAQHQFCVFHVLQIFEREITPKKRDITLEQKTAILNILRAMVYTDSEMKYFHLYQRLKGMKCDKVDEYFDANWHNIRNQWVACYVNQYHNFENRTNNRLESFNQKIKSIVAKYSPLSRFFCDLITCTSAFNIERDHQAADDILRRPLSSIPEKYAGKLYSLLLTSYAYEKYCTQVNKCENLQFTDISERDAECLENGCTITTTEKSCNCQFFKSMDIICAHMLAFLMHHNKPVFQPSLCNKRWLIDNNKFIGEYDYEAIDGRLGQVHVIQSSNQIVQRRRLTPAQKYKKAAKEMKQICELLSEKSHNRFAKFMQQLTAFRKMIEDNVVPSKCIVFPSASRRLIHLRFDPLILFVFYLRNRFFRRRGLCRCGRASDSNGVCIYFADTDR